MGVEGWQKEAGERHGRIGGIFGARTGVGGKTEGKGRGGSERRAAVGRTDTQMDTRTRREPEQRAMGDERDRGMGGMDGGGEGHEGHGDRGVGDGGNERGGETNVVKAQRPRGGHTAAHRARGAGTAQRGPGAPTCHQPPQHRARQCWDSAAEGEQRGDVEYGGAPAGGPSPPSTGRRGCNNRGAEGAHPPACLAELPHPCGGTGHRAGWLGVPRAPGAHGGQAHLASASL